MADYNERATAYWCGLTGLGTVALATAIVVLSQSSGHTLIPVLVGATVATLAGLVPVRIPGAKTSIAAGEIFIFLLLLIHGASAATVAAAAEAAVGSWRTSKRWTSRIASPAFAALAMFFCGSAFDAAIGGLRIAGLMSHGLLLSSLLLFSILYFAVNTLLATLLINLKKSEPLRLRTLLQSFRWIGIAYAGSASISGLLFLTFDRFGFPVLIAAVPIIGMFLATLHYYFQEQQAEERVRKARVDAAEREAEQAARHLEEMRASEQRFHSAFTHASIGMALVSIEGEVLQVNPALCSILGYAEGELIGRMIHDLVHPDEATILARQIGLVAGRDDVAFSTELRCLNRAREEVWVSLHAAFFQESAGGNRCLIFQMQDVTARRTAEARLYHTAYHDALTGLPNRSYFNDQLARAITRVQREPARAFAVMFLDFDRFKMINDSLGHNAGDEFLNAVARRLEASLRPTDVVARLGGDEFAILVEDVTQDRQVIELAERLQQVLQAPLPLGNTAVRTSASIGITFSDLGYQNSEDMLRDADIAMYKAKAAGKARYAIFNAELHEQILAQLQLEGELRSALDRQQLSVVYQPLYAMKNKELIGFEALARWHHPERGDISPAKFIPAAEDAGLIDELDLWVLGQACLQLRAWQQVSRGALSLLMHVNISGRQLAHPGFVSKVLQVLTQTGIDPNRLTLEITESVLMEKMSTAISALEELRELGIGVSIDDFGTGYSSLSYLHSLPFDTVKVDRSFIKTLGDGGKSAEIVRTIVTLGKVLGKGVFAEGIETEEQFRQLMELDCSYAQGDLFSRPLDPHAAENLIVLEKVRAVA
jgi:diguanylate cyclase (GGDEF)-like protein/PAS domain S-box-containing protein